MNIKKILIYGGITIALAVAAYYGYKWYQKRKTDAVSATTPPPVKKSIPVTSAPASTGTATTEVSNG